MKFNESKSQQAVIKWWDMACHGYGLPKGLLFAIPNGGARDVITGSILKAEGVRAGVPDLFLAKPKRLQSGLFIEMKSKGGKVSPQQIEYIKNLSDSGYEVRTCYSSQEAIKVIGQYLGN